MNATAQGSCNCTSGLNVTNSTFSIQKAITFGVLPAGSSSIGCISMPAGSTLLVDADYTFNGTTFNMGSNSNIFVKAPYRLTLDNNCLLKGCEGNWQGIILEPQTGDPGGGLDMEDSKIRDAITGVLAQNQSSLRLVSNDFEDNINGLKITGSVNFVHHLDPNDFKDNRFYAEWPLGNTAIIFENARFFNIGKDLVNPPAIVNYISDYQYGVDIKNSLSIGIYGVTFQELYGTSIDYEPIYSNRICVRSSFSGDVAVKYCTMTGLLNSTLFQPNFGIACYFMRGRQIFHNNYIKANALGISLKTMPLYFTVIELKDNTVSATNPVNIENLLKKPGSSLLVKDNVLSYQPFCYWNICSYYPKGGLSLGSIRAPYRVLSNPITNITSAGSNGMFGIELWDSNGIGEMSDNIIDFQGDKEGTGIAASFVKNCRVYGNTITGANYHNPSGNSGIRTVNSSNVAFCCNSIDQTDLGTRFDMSNTDVKFYTTAYGEHERGLFFPPAATLNPQFNTGNTWAGASTNIDAFYDGTQQQAQANATFQTATANINSSKISPQDWFFLTGTDPSCTQTSFNCPDITPPEEFADLTDADLAALDSVLAENEYVLRFQQKRQLYRKLKENPDLADWNQQVAGFYAAAQGDIVGAFDSLDQAFEQLNNLSPSLESSYNTLAHQIDSLSSVLYTLHAQYPTATPGQQQTLMEQERDLDEVIGGLQDDLNDLLPSMESELETRVTQLLAQNDALNATEDWEINEKNINDLYFRHYAGLIDTFTASEKSDIETLALACPQYEGVGVYKARRLYELFADTVPAYDEHHCQAAEERTRQQRAVAGAFTVTPNPADGRMTVQFGKVLPEGSRLVVSDMTGGIVIVKHVDGISETTLDAADIPPGIYLISVHAGEIVLKTAKAVIAH